MGEQLINLTKKVEDLEKRLATIENRINVNPNSIQAKISKKISLREFLNLKKPSNDVKKTLAISYFLEKFEGINAFNTKDLEAAFEKSKEKKPLNMNDKINLNIKNGHMAEYSEKKDNLKAWYITASGETFVDNGFKARTETK